jgi:hypothetical protein
MTALVSTKPGVFGKSEATAVPRLTFVEAHGARTMLFRRTHCRWRRQDTRSSPTSPPGRRSAS